MPSNEAHRLALALRVDTQDIDLHGLYPDEALSQLDRFIYDCYQARQSVIKVIYGIGSGTLKKAVVSYIADHPLIEEWIDEGGYCVAQLTQA